jgi:hypothetical protein
MAIIGGGGSVPTHAGHIHEIDGVPVGFHAFTSVATDLSPLFAAHYLRTRGTKRGKDHNDRPVSPTVGTRNGSRVLDVTGAGSFA